MRSYHGPSLVHLINGPAHRSPKDKNPMHYYTPHLSEKTTWVESGWVGEKRSRSEQMNKDLLFFLIEIGHPGSAIWRQVCHPILSPLSLTSTETQVLLIQGQSASICRAFGDPWKTAVFYLRAGSGLLVSASASVLVSDAACTKPWVLFNNSSASICLLPEILTPG